MEVAVERGGEGDGSEVLDLPAVGDPKGVTNRALSLPRRVVGERDPRTDVVLVRLWLAESDHARNARDGIQSLGISTDRICPVFVPQTKVQRQARVELEVVLGEPREQTLRAEKTPGAGAPQCPARYVGHQVIDENFRGVVPIISVAPRQEERWVNEMGIFAAELDRVFSDALATMVYQLIGILLSIRVIGGTDGVKPEIPDGHISR